MVADADFAEFVTLPLYERLEEPQAAELAAAA